ncbi:MAG: NAD(+) diphosphatase [Gleimia sp.]|jgi:NAD+ diphosphatase
MTLLLPLSSGQWNPCTYARPFVQPRAVVEGTQDPQTIFDTVLEHCGVKADKIATFLVGERHRYIPNSEGGARHKLGAIENHRVKRVFFLGVDGSTVLLGIQIHPNDTEGYADLRRTVNHVDATDMQLLATCAGLASWHDNGAFCARCGARTQYSAGGWERQCLGCARIEYPRTDPSVIVAIHDDEDRLLVAHNAMWRPHYASLVAGFMEMGEAPEQAVQRETLEEVGLEVDRIEYVASQAWPFPRSLMLGYQARVVDGTSVEPVVDGVELDWARFYSRTEYEEAMRAGEVEAPGPISIARAMVRRWYGGPLPDEQ